MLEVHALVLSHPWCRQSKGPLIFKRIRPKTLTSVLMEGGYIYIWNTISGQRFFKKQRFMIWSNIFVFLLDYFVVNVNLGAGELTHFKHYERVVYWFHFTVFFYPHPRTCLLILERWKRKEREEERNISWLPLTGTPTGDWDQTHNLGMCPDQESNP